MTVRNSPIKVAPDRSAEFGNPRLLVPYAKTQCWLRATELLVLPEFDEVPADFCSAADEEASVEGAINPDKTDVGSSLDVVLDEDVRARFLGGALLLSDREKYDEVDIDIDPLAYN